MAKFFGDVGFISMVKTAPGVMTEQCDVKSYYGDEIISSSRWDLGDKINDDFSSDSRISIVADGYAYQNFNSIRWVSWLGSKWKVTTAQVERPRIILTLGGVYNG